VTAGNADPGAGGSVPLPAAKTDVSCEYAGIGRGAKEFGCEEGIQSIVSAESRNGARRFSEMPREVKSREESFTGLRTGNFAGCVRWNV